MVDNNQIEELARRFCGAERDSWSCAHCKSMFLAALDCKWLGKAREAYQDGWRKEDTIREVLDKDGVGVI